MSEKEPKIMEIKLEDLMRRQEDLRTGKKPYAPGKHDRKYIVAVDKKQK